MVWFPVVKERKTLNLDSTVHVKSYNYTGSLKNKRWEVAWFKPSRKATTA